MSATGFRRFPDFEDGKRSRSRRSKSPTQVRTRWKRSKENEHEVHCEGLRFNSLTYLTVLLPQIITAPEVESSLEKGLYAERRGYWECVEVEGERTKSR